MKKIIIIALAIVVVVLVFSLGSFGVESEAVLAGYENTRKYASDAKLLTVAVDTYRKVVEDKLEDTERRENATPSETPVLGSSGTLLTPEEYEAYVDALVMLANPDIYPADGLEGERDLPATDKSLGAKYDDKTPINYYTVGNNSCSTSGEKEIDAYLAMQCASFADVYVNQVSYKEFAADEGSWLIYGAGKPNQITDKSIFESMGTYWYSDGVDLGNDPEAFKYFFYKVTPGTFVRTDPGNNHSYIILGSDDNGLLIYDANSDGNCGIRLLYKTWSELTAINKKYKGSAYATNIVVIIAPPNTQLPQGCYDNTSQQGYILGKENE